MTLLYANRVHEACSGSGSSHLTLTGALSGKSRFSDKIPTSALVPYVLLDGNGIGWEIGYGTLASATELQRTTVKDSSATSDRVNSETAGTPIKLSLTSNQHEVFIAPFDKTVFSRDEDGNIADTSPIRAALFVDTIAEMTAQTGLVDGEAVFVRGSAALGDGLGACYRWDASDANAAVAPETYGHDSIGTGLFKKVRYDIQGLVRSGDFEVDAKTADTLGGSLFAFFRKKATASTAWARWHAFYASGEAAFKLGIRHLQSSAEKFFLAGVSTGDNFDRVELFEPTVLPTRTNANGFKARAVSWLSGVSRLVMALADAAGSGSAAAYFEIPLTKGGYLPAVVQTITALRAVDATAFIQDGDCALVLGSSALGDCTPFYAKWSAASTATADNWNVFRPSVGAASTGDGRWLRTNVNPTASFANSDATPSIANGGFFATAGTPPAAITDFDDAYEGQIFVVQRGSADQVITHNASVIDCGGADITLTASSPRALFQHVNGIHRLLGGAAVPTLAHEQWLKGRNEAGDGDVNMFRIVAGDYIEVGGSGLYFDNTANFTERTSVFLTARYDNLAPTTLHLLNHMFVVGKGDNTNYPRGVGCMYLDAIDDSSVDTDGERGILYTLQATMSPKRARGNTPIDDVAAVIVQHNGTAKGTEHIYIGLSATMSGASESTGGIGMECNADNAMYATGDYAVAGINFSRGLASPNHATFGAGGALCVPSGSLTITGRNAANSAYVEILEWTSGDVCKLMGKEILAWADWAPTVSAGTGTLTTAGGTAGACRWSLINNVVTFTSNISTADIGTGGQDLRFTLPVQAEKYTEFSARRTSTGTVACAHVAAASSICILTLSGGANPLQSGAFYAVSGSYEVNY